MSEWESGLNPEQVQAVRHNYGPLLILAGAGSGKTTVLVARTGRLVAEKVARADEICVLTFTNKAARELKHRVSKKLGGRAKGLWAGTFHSFGLQILRRFHRAAGLSPQFGIVDQSDCHAIIKDLLKNITNSTKSSFDPDKLLNQINDLRMGYKSTMTDEYAEMAEALMPAFVKRLSNLGVVDFEGLLMRPIQLFKEHPDILEKVQSSFTQVMVDEFQDTNKMQMQLIELLVGSHQNITVVGDDDQSIYGWRGAEVKNILNFPKDYKNCEVIKLERNYRSSAEILALANATIAQNKNRHGKVLKASAAKSTGELPELFILEREEDESDFVASEIQYFLRQEFKYSDFAVLYRSNTQGGLIEASLRRAQIPYNMSGGTSLFDRKEAKDVLAYIKCALHPNEVSLRRIINTPSRGIGDTTVEKITEIAQSQKLTFVEACEKIVKAQESILDFEKQGTLVMESETSSPFKGELQPKAIESLGELLQFLKKLPEAILDFRVGSSPGEKLQQLFTDNGYKNYLFNSVTEPATAEKKWMVIEILGRILDSFMVKRAYTVEVMKEFLDAMMLRDDLGDEADSAPKVQLMTLHASKGLEFPIVILAGIEEDLLPHKKLGSDIDEERRLFYVGVTRAKQKLIMSRCQQRKKNGAVKPVAPSRFLLELPTNLYKQSQTGFRPVSGEARDNLVASFLSGLGKK